MSELRRRSPTIVVLEDAHWADDATFDLLRLLARRVKSLPAALLVSYRQTELGRFHPLRQVLGEFGSAAGEQARSGSREPRHLLQPQPDAVRAAAQQDQVGLRPAPASTPGPAASLPFADQIQERTLRSEMIDVTTPDGVADAYLARPDDERRPAVLLVMDAYGLRPQIERMADRIATQGYVVLAPNVFYRAGRAPVVPLDGLGDPDQQRPLLDRIRPLMRELTPERIVGDGAAYLDRLEQIGRGPVAITGYCMGGRVAWRIAAAYPERVAALGGFHVGGLVSDDDDSPHGSAGSLAAEVYLGFADNDRSMTREQIAELERALDAAGVRYRSEVYSGAAHGYTMADTPAYNEAATERHYAELFALLDRTLARAGSRPASDP
jgi:carboxymethylenebutenolidase